MVEGSIGIAQLPRQGISQVNGVVLPTETWGRFKSPSYGKFHGKKYGKYRNILEHTATHRKIMGKWWEHYGNMMGRFWYVCFSKKPCRMEWGSKYGDKLNAKVLAAGDEAAGSWILPWCPRYNSSLVVEPPAAEHMKPWWPSLMLQLSIRCRERSLCSDIHSNEGFCQCTNKNIKHRIA